MSALSLESSLRRFSEKFHASAELTDKTRGMIPKGYSRGSVNFGPHAIFVEKGQGAYIRTIEGRELLDLNNNFTVNILGHGNPAVNAALHDAISGGISFGNPCVTESQLAELLIDRIPSVETVQFSCSATESCMSAVRIARAYTGRTKVAKVEGGYHGFSDTLFVSSHTMPEDNAGSDSTPRPTADSGGIPNNLLENIVVVPQNDIDGAERQIRANADDIACLIFELQSGSGGLVSLDQEFVERMREVTSELGILLVFDETISLRAHYNGLQSAYGVTPDLTVMGKIIGGGMPLGAVGGASEIMAIIGEDRVTLSGTHHGHKLSVAAGLACMNELTPESLEQLNGKARRIREDINEWSKVRNSPFAVYGNNTSHIGYGYMTAPGKTVRNHRDYWRNVDAEKTQICSLELANRGFFPVHRGEISLSLAMTDHDVSRFVETLKEIVTELEE